MTLEVPRRSSKSVLAYGFLLSSVLLLSGCTPVYPLTPIRPGVNAETLAPTGDILFAEARENFIQSRSELSDFLAEFETGPWDVLRYGYYPVECGSGDDAGYYFEISRMITRPGLDMDAYAERSVELLSAAGFATEITQHSEEKINVLSKRETGPLSDVYVGLMANGSFFVKANSICFPGDMYELASLLTNGFSVKELPAPLVDAPSDPPQFGLPE